MKQVDSKCSIDNCLRNAKTKLMCHAHYKRYLKFGNAFPAIPLGRGHLQREKQPCQAAQCDERSYAKQLCKAHYERSRTKGHLGIQPINKRGLNTTPGCLDESGYRKVYRDGRKIREHVWIMEQILNRRLLPKENVHHINGVRDDNRPENLELWSTSQPSGQRAEDKYNWAKEIIALYEHLF